MKKRILFIFAIIVASFVQAQVVKKITLTPGTLLNNLTPQELATITDLTIDGAIDARDFEVMRDKMLELQSIDLSAVSIDAYSGTDGTDLTASQSYPVNEVPIYAFKNNNKIKTVILPSSATSCGAGVFNSCDALTTVKMPEQVTILPNDFFSGCLLLTSVEMPKNLTEIGVYAFTGCSSLENLSLPTTLKTIGGYAFEGCKFSTIMLPNSLESIGEGAFYVCKSMTSIVLPSSLKEVSNALFNSCTALKSVVLPNTITAINDNAFYGCSALTDLTLPSSVTKIGTYAFLNCSSLVAINIPQQGALKAISDNAFNGCFKLKSIVIPASVSYIGNYAFQKCESLASIKVMNPVPYDLSNTMNPFSGVPTAICKLFVPAGSMSAYLNAFGWQDFMSNTFEFSFLQKELTINAGELNTVLGAEMNSVTDLILSGTIDARDFETMKDSIPLLNYVDLRNTTIVEYTGEKGPQTWAPATYPANTIPIYAFDNNSSIETLFLPNGATTLDIASLRGAHALVYFPAALSTIQNAALSYASARISVDPDNLFFTSENDVLYNKNKTKLIFCSTIKTGVFNIPSSVTEIGDYAFQSCSLLSNIIIPPSVEKIGGAAFTQCSGLLTMDLPKSIKTIGFMAFSLCSFSSIVIPEGVKELNNNTFMDCSQLQTVSLPKSLSSIGESAFKGCISLQLLKVYNPIPVDLSLFAYVFQDVNTSTCVLEVPYTSVSNYKNAKKWESFSMITEREGIILDKHSVVVDNDASTELISFTSNAAWTASTNASWAHVGNGSGTGDSYIGVSIDQNLGADRSTYIYFQVKEMIDSVLLSQKQECIAKPIITGDTKICSGNVSELYVDNTNPSIGVIWFEDPALTKMVGNGIKYSFSPLSNSSLYVAYTAGANCMSLSTQVDITVNSLPNVTASASGDNVCQNTEITFVGSSSQQLTYKWSSNITDGVPFPVYSTNTYTVTGTDANGCSATASVAVSVKPFTSILGNASKPEVCAGETVTLWGSGGVSYQWEKGVEDNVPFTPTTSDYYIVTGTDVNGCTSVGYVSVYVNPLPVFTINPVQQSVLSGEAVTLSCTGADSYQWDNGVTEDVAFTPTATNTYTVTGYSPLGCMSTSSVTITVFDSKSVIAVTAGQLSSLFTSTQKSNITHLNLSGTIDARDFKTMRDSLPALTYIDLSQASIVAYDGNYGTNLPSINGQLPDFMHFGADTIPLLALKDKSLIDTVILPINASVIGNSAFSGCTNLSYVPITNVTVIDNYAFENCNFTIVEISAAITSLGEGVLMGNKNLETVLLPNSIKDIPSYFFQNCAKLQNINIPESVLTIGKYAFTACDNLKSITFPSLLSQIDDYAFWKCSSLSSIDFWMNPSLISIGKYSFNGCQSLINLELPQSLSSLGSAAFMDCLNLETVSIPKNVASIGDYAFMNCEKLNSITVFRSLPLSLLETSGVFSNVNTSTCKLKVPYGSQSQYAKALVWKDFLTIEESPMLEKQVYTSPGMLSSQLTTDELQSLSKLIISGGIDATDFKTMRDNMPKLEIIDLSNAYIIEYSGSDGTGIGNLNYSANQIPILAFVSKSSLKCITLPMSTQSIANAAFEYCSSLSSCNYPAGLSSIGAEAFYGTAIEQFEKSSSLSIVKTATFKNCSKLQTVSIPSTVIMIEDEAFINCSSIKSINVYASVPPTLGSGVFTGVDKQNCTLHVPVGTLAAYKSADKWKDFFNIEEFDQSVAPHYTYGPIQEQFAMGDMFYPLDFKQYIVDDYTPYEKLQFSFEPNEKIELSSVDGLFVAKQKDLTWTGSETIQFTVTNEANVSFQFPVVFTQMTLLQQESIKPICSFTASKLFVKTNQITKFYSNNKYAESVEWTFEGGTPETSNAVSPTVTYDAPGKFFVTLKATNADGETILTKTGYITVSALSLADTTICKGDSVEIAVLGNGFNSFMWNTNPQLTSQSIKVGPTEKTTYIVTMKKGLLTSIVDSVTINISQQPDLGKDTSFCEGGSISLNPGKFSQYFWNGEMQTGNASLVISNSGINTVKTIDELGCAGYDTVEIKPLYTKPTVSLGNDTSFCWKKKITLDAGSAKTYEWSNGLSSQTIDVDTTGLYSVTITDNHSCTNADTIAIHVKVPIIPSIGILTHSSKDKNLIAWEPINNKGVQLYHVWKENSSGKFEIINTRIKGDTTVSIDETSNPKIASFRYALSTVDSACGNESYLSAVHSSIMLKCLLKDAKTVSVSWNKYVGTDVQKYYIYRAMKGQSLALYDSVEVEDADKINYEYIDTNALGLGSYYQIQFNLTQKIIPSRLKSDSGPFSQSLSNLAESELTASEIETVSDLLFFPNPAQTEITFNKDAYVQIYTLNGISLLSKQVLRFESLSLKQLQSGMYIVKMYTKDTVFVETLIKD